MAYQPQQGPPQGYGRDQQASNPFGSQQGHGSIPPPSQPAGSYPYGSSESEEFREPYASEEDARRGEHAFPEPTPLLHPATIGFPA